jgi:hypothetical protein
VTRDLFDAAGPEEIVGPRRLSGVVTRPRNFTVGRRIVAVLRFHPSLQRWFDAFVAMRVVLRDAKLHFAIQGC